MRIRAARYALVILFLANLLNWCDRQIVYALFPLIQGSWRLSDTQLGLLGTAFEVAFPLMSIPLSLFSDRWLRSKLVALCLALWSLATAASGLVRSYSGLLLGRALVGTGQAGYGPSALALISDHFPRTSRSRAAAAHDLAVVVGSMLGFVAGASVASALGWQRAFVLAGLPGLLLAPVIWLTLDEPKRGASERAALAGEETAGQAPPFSAPALRELVRPTVLVVVASGTLITFSTSGLTAWLPTYAVRALGFDLARVMVAVGGFQALAGVLGVLAGGFLADAAVRRHPGGRFMVIALGFLVGTPLAIGALLTTSGTLFLMGVAVSLFFFMFYFPCMAPLLHEVTQPSLRASAMGAYTMVVHIVGSALSGPLIGQISDRTGDLRLGLLLIPATALAGGLVALWGARFVARDRARMLAGLQGR